MKLAVFVFMISIIISGLSAQVLSNYTYSNTNSPYIEIVGGTVLGSDTTTNQYFTDPAVPLGNTGTTTGTGFPIGFNFVFNGHTFDRVGVCADGWISLGSSSYAPSVNLNSTNRILPLSSLYSINPAHLVTRVSAMGIDLSAQTGASILISTIGVAPNREFVVQWKGYKKTAGTGDNFNFQIRLTETSNIISITYGSITNNATAASPQVGIRVEPAATATNYRNRSTTTSWMSTIEGAAATATCTLSNAVYPASGTMFTWTPPASISGNFVIGAGGDFASFTTAINYLNGIVTNSGIGPGGITFYVPAGSVFIENPPAITLSALSDRPIRFLKSGSGLNPVIKATGTAVATDAIITLSGADWYTFDGIDLANADGTTAMEYGYFLNALSYNGCENNTISNGKVTLSYATTASKGIYSYGFAYSPNKANRFENMTLENMINGVYLLGSAGSPMETNYNQSEVVTGCTFSEITAYGIYVYYETACELSNNTISMHTGNALAFYGICFYSNNGSAQINGNIITGGSNTNASYGIYYLGANGSIYDNSVSGFTSPNTSVTGIFVGDGIANVYQNTVHSISCYGNATGIQVVAAVDQANVYRNEIYNLTCNYTSSGYIATGLSVGGTLSTVSNNLIYKISCPGSALPKVIGITVISGTTIRLLNNTVLLKSDAVSNGGSAALFINSEIPALELQNNIFVNLYMPGTRAVAMWKYSAGFSRITANSDRNIYYAGTPSATHLICYAGTNSYQTLTDYKTANTDKDQGSFTENVPFISSVDPMNVHISSSTPTRVEGNAIPIVDVTNDFDEDVRNATTPDIGADEGAFTSLGQVPNIVNMPLPANGSIAQSPASSLSWTAGLEGGVPTGYKIFLGTDGGGAVTPTNVCNGLDLGDVLSYTPSPVLQYLTTYYWKVVPYNEIGDAENCPIWGFGTHDLPLTGIKTIGSTGYYHSFDEAIRHLNAAGVGVGGVTFSVAAGETFLENPVPITATGTAVDSILFTTDGSSITHPILRANGTTGNYGIKIEGGDHITFDGIDIANRVGSTNLVNGYWILGLTGNGASNIEIRNCNITLSRSVTSYGISATTVTGATNNDLNIHSNTIDNATYSVNLVGVTGTQNIMVTNNTITNTSTGVYVNYGSATSISLNHISFPSNSTVPLTGINASYLTNGLIFSNVISSGHTTSTITALYAYYGTTSWFGNSVNNLSCSSSLYGWACFTGTHSVYNNEISGLSTVSSVYGINLSPGSSYTANVRAYGNKIHDLTSTTAGNYMCCGIYSYGLGTNVIYNNYIFDLKNNSGSTAPQVRGVCFESSSTAEELYFNTIYLNATGTNANYSTAALYSSITGSLRMNNNIFVNQSTHGTTGKTVSFWKNNTGFDNLHADTDKNIYYAGTPDATRLICYNGTTSYQLLDDYKAANPGKDQGSFSENTPFVSSSAPFDMHINPALPTRVESNGISISGITTDYDNDLRNVTTPDIGADEGNFSPVVELPVPAIAYYPTNTEIVVPLRATLSWFPGSGGGNVAGYRIYLGTDNPPTNVLNGTDIGDVFTYTLGADLNYLTLYNWQIVPYNSQGSALNCPVWTFETLDVPMTGAKTIGQFGTYPNFTIAIRHLNADGVGTNGVTFNVAAGEIFTENPPAIITSGTSTKPILFQSSDSLLTNPVLKATGGTNTFGIKISGGDYFTFDRIDITNVGVATNLTYGFWLDGLNSNGALYNTIKNCHITLSKTNTSSCSIYSNGISNGTNNNLNLSGNTIDNVYTGIYLGNNGITNNIMIQDNHLTNVSSYGIRQMNSTNTTIQGNQIEMAAGNTTAFYGLRSESGNNTGTYSSNVIIGATTNSSFGGIYTWYGTMLITGNEVKSFISTGTAQSYGIYTQYGTPTVTNNHVHSLSGNCSIIGIDRYGTGSSKTTGNHIHDISYTGSSSYFVTGMLLSGSTGAASNNMIYDLRNAGGNTAPQVRGMHISTCNSNPISYNSILLNTSGTNANFSTAALYLESGTTIKFKNNIFMNLSSPGSAGLAVAIWNTLSGFSNISTDSNNNIYYAGSPWTKNLISYNATIPHVTMSDYLTAIADRDQGSFTESVPFISIIDPVDLHIRSDLPTRVEGNAIPVTGMTDDYDGNIRNAYTPDIGADEGDFEPIPGPPLSPIVISPAHLAENIALNAQLSWVPGAGGLPTSYDVYLGTVNPPPYVATVEAASYMPTLLPQTTYYWKIKAVNSYGEAMSLVWNFVTRDDFTIYDITFAEGFEAGNTNGSTSINRWTQQLQSNSSYWTANSVNTTYNRTPRTGAFNVTLANTGNCWLFRPMVMDSTITYEMSVWVRQNTNTLSQASLKIAYGTSPSSVYMTHNILTTTNFTYGDYQNLVGTFKPDTPGLYYIGIQGIVSGAYNYISMDDISIYEHVPIPIFSVTPELWYFGRVDVGSSSVAKDFIITNTGDADLIINRENVNIIGLGAASYQLTPIPDIITLHAGQTYTMYVTFAPIAIDIQEAELQIIDNTSQRGTHSIPLTGRGIGPLPVPMMMDFETGWDDWVVVNGTQANKWQTSALDFYGGLRAAYISNDDGSTIGYDTGTASVTHFYHDIQFPADMSNIHLIFNWKDRGEADCDYLSVHLVDLSVVPVAGEELNTGLLGTNYQDEIDWQSTRINLNPTLAGQAKRLVFTWTNNGSGGVQLPACVDKIRILGNVPPLDMPLNLQMSADGSNITIIFDPVTNANEYELEDADMYDSTFNFILRSGNPQFTMPGVYSRRFFRIRAGE